MGTHCLYCTRPTGPEDGLAHVFPECLWKNDSVLPLGAVCRPCNGYFGSKLDPHLIKYPPIALAVQFLGTPGKDGAARKVVGGIECGKAHGEDWAVRMPIPKPSIAEVPGGTSQAIIEVPSGKGFSLLRFRRALHRIALEALALAEDVEYVRTARFAEARAYVKNPSPAELSWGFAELMPEGGGIPPVLSVIRYESGRREIVGLQIFQAIYVVDLMNTGELGRLAQEQEAIFVDPRVRAAPLLRLVAEGELARAKDPGAA